MTFFRITPQPLRQFMLRWIGVLVLMTAAMVSVNFIGFGLLPMAEQVAQAEIDTAAQQVEAGLNRVFAPPLRLLSMSRGWLAGQAPDLASPLAFNQLFKPVLQANPELTSVVAGTSSGQGWLLLQQGGAGWRNRMTDLPRWGVRRHRLLDEAADGQLLVHWSEQFYDPQLRPWFMGAMALTEPGAVHWTAPYTFFTTGDPGITASARTRLADGRDFVLGFDLRLRDLSQSTMQAAVGQHGMALVLTSDDRVLALPAAPDPGSTEEWLKKALQPSTALGLPALDAALQRWRAAGRLAGRVLSFEAQGTRWLVSVRPYALGEQRFRVVLLAPAADFAPAWAAIAWALAAALALALALALWLTRLSAVRLSRPLETLAANSRQIGQLDLSPLPALRSRVVEIQQLASSQQDMLSTLRHNQQEIEAHADALVQQVQVLKATEERLQQQNERLLTIIDNFPGGVSVVDAELRIVAYNTQFQTLLSLPDELLKQPHPTFEKVVRYNALRGDYGAGEVETLVAQRVALAREFKAHRLERTLPNGITLEVRGMPLPQGGFVTLYIDVSAAKAHQAELEHLAHFDALTGLPNRVLLADRLRQGMAQVARRGQQLGVAYLDLDGFKAINDSFGHGVGDLLLVGLANRMKQTLRDGDTLARIGGDEFVAVLMDVAGLDESAPMLRRLLDAADAPLTVEGHELRLSASVGVTFFPQDNEVEPDQLLRQADQAMYLAKQRGKNRYHVFDTAHDRSLRGQIEARMRIGQALAQQELVLYYQPKVNLGSGAVYGVEALIRWQHPQQGLLAPLQFLPLIEDDVLALRVGEWVVRTALAQLAAWQAQGLSLGVSVNVGAQQLQDPGFVTFLRGALGAQPQVRPKNLQIEVLETSALQDVVRATEVMAQCRALGVQFALDDFGTGYSSLTYLKRLPVSELKIDQSFVRNMQDDPDDLSILLGVLDLARSFNLQVIAEGVETMAHGHMLLQLGCERAQGFGIARPMPAGELLHWAAHWQPDAALRGVGALPRASLPLLLAQVEHRAWVLGLQAYLQGRRQQPPALDGLHCQLGKCVQGNCLPQHPDQRALADMLLLHRRIHELAAHLCWQKAQGQAMAASAGLPQLLELHDLLLAQLRGLLANLATALN